MTSREWLAGSVPRVARAPSMVSSDRRRVAARVGTLRPGRTRRPTQRAVSRVNDELLMRSSGAPRPHTPGTTSGPLFAKVVKQRCRSWRSRRRSRRGAMRPRDLDESLVRLHNPASVAVEQGEAAPQGGQVTVDQVAQDADGGEQIEPHALHLANRLEEVALEGGELAVPIGGGRRHSVARGELGTERLRNADAVDVFFGEGRARERSHVEGAAIAHERHLLVGVAPHYPIDDEEYRRPALADVRLGGNHRNVQCSA